MIDKTLLFTYSALAFLVILTLTMAFQDKLDLWPEDTNWKKSVSFGKIWRSSDLPGDELSNFYLLDYFIGPVPQNLIDMTSKDLEEGEISLKGQSAAIIVVVMWIAFLLIFMDIMSR